jgi:flavorubredoxin
MLAAAIAAFRTWITGTKVQEIHVIMNSRFTALEGLATARAEEITRLTGLLAGATERLISTPPKEAP